MSLDDQRKKNFLSRCRLYASIAIGFSIASFFVHLEHDLLFFTSLGATSCILFTAPSSKPAAWWRILAAHPLCAVVGVASRSFVGDGWIACSVCVVSAIILMDALDIIHPPAAATSLVGFTTDRGYLVALTPVLAGMVVLVIVAKTTLKLFDVFAGTRKS